MSKIKDKVVRWVAEKGEFCLRDCKEALDFNRVLGQSVLEYLDRLGFTIKQGEGRIVAGRGSPRSSGGGTGAGGCR